MDGLDELFETYRHIERELSTTIRIDHRQVSQITVGDLIAKYKQHQENEVYRNAFEVILRGFYLTEKEFNEVRGWE